MIIMGAAVWALVVPLGKRVPEGVMRAVTIFGGAFLLAVCCLDMLPEVAGMYGLLEAEGRHMQALSPFFAILAGFLIQQLLESLSSHAEHGHIETAGSDTHTPMPGLMLGLSLHALLEGMPLVSQELVVDRGLLWGIVVHNRPVALILTGLMVERGYGFWRVLLLLLVFGAMSPLGSLFKTFVLQPGELLQHIIVGLVIGVLLHVSSSILFDHKRNHFSWLNVAIIAVAFCLAALITI